MSILMDAQRGLRSFGKDRIGPMLAVRRPCRVDPPIGTWGLSTSSGGSLVCDGVDLVRVVEAHGSPVQVVSGTSLARNLSAAIAPFEAGCGCDIFYSYKTNPVPGVLRIMHERGVGAEVISPFELWLALELGVPGERLIYNGPAKSTESIRRAIEVDTLLINANSSSEIGRIRSLAEQTGKVANLGIRISLPGMWGGQFGIRERETAIDAIRSSLGSSHLALSGLHFHRGGTMRTHVEFSSYIETVLAFCDLVRSRTGWTPMVLDLGGSLACPTVATITGREYRFNRAFGTDLLPPDPASCLRLGEASALAYSLVDDHFSSAGLPTPLTVLEPGRALSADTQMLLTSVIDVKDDAGLDHVILDAGVNIAEPVTSEYHHLLDVSRPYEVAEHHYRLTGPICTPADVLYNDWRLSELEPGRILAIMDTGAYCVPFSTAFSFPRPPIVMLERGEIRVLRRSESFVDLVALDSPLALDEEAER